MPLKNPVQPNYLLKGFVQARSDFKPVLFTWQLPRQRGVSGEYESELLFSPKNHHRKHMLGVVMDAAPAPELHFWDAAGDRTSSELQTGRSCLMHFTCAYCHILLKQ